MSSPHVWPVPRCPNPQQQPGLQEYEGVAGQRGTLDIPWRFPEIVGLWQWWLLPQELPSGKHTKNYGTPPFLIGKSTINRNFQ